ncbi:MAG: carboxypeptidase regulatory-like domain-containing protein [Anaerolineales bacterium]|nr:carboxypeptidase regulatory-like domain-containing protein [Anaerolineales bacterium]
MKRLLCFLVALALSACSGQTTQLSSYELPRSVDVTFSALLPQDTPAGEQIFLVLLDDVTGLALNTQPIAMHSTGEQSVSLKISIPQGSLLKYRYMRQGVAGSANEAAANGTAIEFRAFYVDGPGHVAHDMVAAWTDMHMQQETGQVSGQLTGADGSPLADMVVVAAGLQTRTDPEGQFVLPGLLQGLHNVLAYSPNGSQRTFQQGALVAAHSDTPATIEVQPSSLASVTFWLTPPADHTAGTPVFLTGNLDNLAARPLMISQADGRYGLILQLPTGVDIRYKYTLGDGLWNAEHLSDGSFLLRQLIIPDGTSELEIHDQAVSWSAGSAAPIWFELQAPGDNLLAYVQFKLGDWSTPLPTWPLGPGHWAYRLNSPTNFAQTLEYRYCLDPACTVVDSAGIRSVEGNQPQLQEIRDVVAGWQSE